MPLKGVCNINRYLARATLSTTVAAVASAMGPAVGKSQKIVCSKYPNFLITLYYTIFFILNLVLQSGFFQVIILDVLKSLGDNKMRMSEST